MPTQKSSVWLYQIIFILMIFILAQPASAQSNSLTVTKTLSPRQQAAAAAYWTRARIAAAQPIRLPIDNAQQSMDTTAVEEAALSGPMGSTPAGMADPDADQIARAAYAEDWAALDQEPAPALDEPADDMAGTSGVYTSYDVNTNTAIWQIYPHVWSGKLTFTTPTGTASCSATAISKNNIVTAAHCVYDTAANAFYSNWAFTPGFRNGATPYGTFTARACSVLTTYVNLGGAYSINSWARHDVAVCSMNNNSIGQTLNGAVGFAGRLWNASNTQLVFINGYPARTYTDALISNGPAQYLRSCTAETALHTTETLRGGCNWSRGISGGSWLIEYKPFVVSGRVNGVTSGFIVNGQNLYGARFNSNNIVPLCTARGC